MTIALSILPVFLAVMLCMKDRQAQMSELVYTRQTSGFKIVFARFLAFITAEMLPILILSYVSNMSVWGMYPGMKLDYLAPLKYDFGWLMPTAMIVTAAGMFLTELTDTPIAVAVCGLWWLVDVNQGLKSVQKDYALLRLAPRHNSGANSYFRTEDFLDNLGRLAANRLFFAAVSVLLVVMTVLVYEAKRKGEKFLSVWELTKSNLKHNIALPAAVSAAILLMTPVLFGTANLDRETSAIPLETFLSLVGIALFTPVFQPEERKEIDDLVSSKYVSAGVVWLIRTVCAMILVTAFVGAFAFYMRLRLCDVSFVLFAGTVADAVFLGGLGMLGAASAGNTVTGYMAALVYYGINCGAGRKLGKFYLFSMCHSEYEPKIWLFGAGTFLILAALAVRQGKKWLL